MNADDSLHGRKRGSPPEPHPLEVLALSAQVAQQTKEEKLQALPRWRFRRRRHLEQSLRHRQEWQQSLNDALATKGGNG